MINVKYTFDEREFDVTDFNAYWEFLKKTAVTNKRMAHSVSCAFACWANTRLRDVFDSVVTNARKKEGESHDCNAGLLYEDVIRKGYYDIMMAATNAAENIAMTSSPVILSLVRSINSIIAVLKDDSKTRITYDYRSLMSALDMTYELYSLLHMRDAALDKYNRAVLHVHKCMDFAAETRYASEEMFLSQNERFKSMIVPDVCMKRCSLREQCRRIDAFKCIDVMNSLNKHKQEIAEMKAYDKKQLIPHICLRDASSILYTDFVDLLKIIRLRVPHVFLMNSIDAALFKNIYNEKTGSYKRSFSHDYDRLAYMELITTLKCAISTMYLSNCISSGYSVLLDKCGPYMNLYSYNDVVTLELDKKDKK